MSDSSKTGIGDESERFVERMLETTPNLIYIYDLADGRNVYTNRELAEFLGYSADEIAALGPDLFARILHPDDTEAIKEHHGALRQLAPGDDRVLELHYRAKRADGEWRCLHSRDVPFARDATGAVTQILGSAEDVTRRAEAEEALRASEKRYRSIVENMLDAYFRADLDGRLVDASPSAARMFGFDSVDEMFGTEASALFADIADWRAMLEELHQHRCVADRPSEGRRKDGSTFWVSTNVAIDLDEEGRAAGTVAFARDISERVRTEEALMGFAERQAALFQSMQDGFVVVDANGVHVDMNPAFCALTGYSEEELIGTGLPHAYWPASETDRVGASFGRAVSGDSREVELTFVRKSGERIPVVLSPSVVRDADGNVELVFATVKDVTERTLAERERAEQEARVQAVLDNAPYGAHMYELDSENRLIFVGYNRRADEILGIDHVDLLGKTLEEAFPGNVGTDTPDAYRRVAREGGTWEIDQYAYDSGGIAGIFEVYAFSFGPSRVSVFFRDVTEKRKLELALQASEERNRVLIEEAGDGIFVADSSGRYVEVNDQGCTMLGRTREEILTLSIGDLLPPDDLAETPVRLEELRAGEAVTSERRMIRGDGSLVDVEINAKLLPDGRLLGLTRDITARKTAERKLDRATRALQALSACNEALVRSDDEQQLLTDICDVAVTHGRYAMAWIGYAGCDEEFSIMPMASAGRVDGYLDDARFDWSDDNTRNGAVGHAIRTGEPFVIRFIASDPLYAPWRDAALARGYESVAALPLIDKTGEVFGALVLMSGEHDSYDNDEIALLRELADDVAFGVDTVRGRIVRAQMEANLLRSNERLEGILLDLTQAMGKVVEARDPYTQGHEERVCVLAVAIARKMGLPAEDVEAIKVAALVHDVGKLAVPAEILTKPGKLTAVEFQLIKEHSRTGYEILKDIAFSWPVADIVLQHHERMDGSGYPSGLRGNEIMTAARIIAVADVVEAMASDRPYRPSLGFETAMAELSECAAKYDPEAVHACLELYASGELSFDTPAEE